MKVFKKILITLLFSFIIYYTIFNTILYFDPTHPNIRGLRSLAIFPTIFISYFIGSYLARK